MCGRPFRIHIGSVVCGVLWCILCNHAAAQTISIGRHFRNSTFVAEEKDAADSAAPAVQASADFGASEDSAIDVTVATYGTRNESDAAPPRTAPWSKPADDTSEPTAPEEANPRPEPQPVSPQIANDVRRHFPSSVCFAVDDTGVYFVQEKSGMRIEEEVSNYFRDGAGTPDELRGPESLDRIAIETPMQLAQLDEQPEQPFDTAPVEPFDAAAEDPFDITPEQPFSTTPFDQAVAGLDFGEGAGIGFREFGEITGTSSVGESVTGAEQSILAVSETSNLLEQSNTVQTVSTRQLSPVSFEPRIRGFQGGQIYSQADGVYWLAARRDLDSMLSKLDPSLIRDIQVLPGPYGLRYGPGFAFIDVQTLESPRYFNGFESHARVGLTYRGNGDQTFGTATAVAGNCNWGCIVNYGNRNGIDYRSGNGHRIPSSYLTQNYMAQIGFDLAPCTTVEIRHQRLDQVDTEYAGQFFDLNYLGTQAFSASLVSERPCRRWTRFRADAWWNRSRYTGDTLGSGKRSPIGIGAVNGGYEFHVLDRVDYTLNAQNNLNYFNPQNPTATSIVMGATNGDQVSTGGRAVWTFGDEDWTQLDVGMDFRYVEQEINERFQFAQNFFPSFDTNMPRAKTLGPGLFVEAKIPAKPFWKITAGARVDWLRSSASDIAVRPGSSLPGAPGNIALDQTRLPYAFYLLNDVDLSPQHSVRIGFGHAQRVPDLYQLYADGVFMGIIQNGFSRIIGRPELPTERLWQIDARFNWEHEDFRGRIGAFHSWILDYATYEGITVAQLADARLMRSISTDLVTLTGFEGYAEWECLDGITVFGSAEYVDGRDRVIEQPLYGISPLEGRIGARLVDPDDGQTWGGEMGVRMVYAQNRLGAIRTFGSPGTPLPLETSTSGFNTVYLRGYYNVSENLHIVGGVENLTDRNYIEHNNLRLTTPAPPYPTSAVLAPGITPYLAVEWRR